MGKTVEELQEELDRVRANYDSLYDHHTHVVECKNEEIAELKKQLKEYRRREYESLNPSKSRELPEGIQWPRFTDGEPVKFGDEVDGIEGKCSTRTEFPSRWGIRYGMRWTAAS